MGEFGSPDSVANNRSWRLLSDPMLIKGARKCYRYDDSPAPDCAISREDPRQRHAFALQPINLPIPRLKMDENSRLSREIGIINLNETVTADELKRACSNYGPVAKTRVLIHPTTKMPLKLGRVVFESIKHAQSFYERFNNAPFLGKNVKLFRDCNGTKLHQVYKDVLEKGKKSFPVEEKAVQPSVSVAQPAAVDEVDCSRMRTPVASGTPVAVESVAPEVLMTQNVVPIVSYPGCIPILPPQTSVQTPVELRFSFPPFAPQPPTPMVNSPFSLPLPGSLPPASVQIPGTPSVPASPWPRFWHQPQQQQQQYWHAGPPPPPPPPQPSSHLMPQQGIPPQIGSTTCPSLPMPLQQPGTALAANLPPPSRIGPPSVAVAAGQLPMSPSGYLQLQTLGLSASANPYPPVPFDTLRSLASPTCVSSMLAAAGHRTTTATNFVPLNSSNTVVFRDHHHLQTGASEVVLRNVNGNGAAAAVTVNGPDLKAVGDVPPPPSSQPNIAATVVGSGMNAVHSSGHWTVTAAAAPPCRAEGGVPTLDSRKRCHHRICCPKYASVKLLTTGLVDGAVPHVETVVDMSVNVSIENAKEPQTTVSQTSTKAVSPVARSNSSGSSRTTSSHTSSQSSSVHSSLSSSSSSSRGSSSRRRRGEEEEEEGVSDSGDESSDISIEHRVEAPKCNQIVRSPLGKRPFFNDDSESEVSSSSCNEDDNDGLQVVTFHRDVAAAKGPLTTAPSTVGTKVAANSVDNSPYGVRSMSISSGSSDNAAKASSPDDDLLVRRSEDENSSATSRHGTPTFVVREPSGSVVVPDSKAANDSLEANGRPVVVDQKKTSPLLQWNDAVIDCSYTTLFGKLQATLMQKLVRFCASNGQHWRCLSDSDEDTRLHVDPDSSKQSTEAVVASDSLQYNDAAAAAAAADPKLLLRHSSPSAERNDSPDVVDAVMTSGSTTSESSSSQGGENSAVSSYHTDSSESELDVEDEDGVSDSSDYSQSDSDNSYSPEVDDEPSTSYDRSREKHFKITSYEQRALTEGNATWTQEDASSDDETDYDEEEWSGDDEEETDYDEDTQEPCSSSVGPALDDGGQALDGRIEERQQQLLDDAKQVAEFQYCPDAADEEPYMDLRYCDVDVEDVELFKRAFDAFVLAKRSTGKWGWLRPTADDVERYVMRRDNVQHRGGGGGGGRRTVHLSGSARTEGFYRMPKKKKTKTTPMVKLAAAFEPSPKVATEGDDTAKGGTLAHETRAEARALQRLLFTNYGAEVDSDLLKYDQMQSRSKLVRFDNSKIHGWGLFALEDIAPDEMIIEYIGQKIRLAVAERREDIYAKRGIGSSYLFRMDNDWVIDATRHGNMARFINHSCAPNCYAKVIAVSGFKRIVIYSKQSISRGEEITYDYKFPLEDEKIPCNCGAANCRRSLN